MSIPVSNSGPKGPPPGLEQSSRDKDRRGDVKVDNGNKVKDVESPASAVAKARASANSAIVQTQLNVALNSGDDPLALVLKAAINGINEALEPTLGKDAILHAAASRDNSAEATAGRILSLSTALYGAYIAQNKLEDNAASREKFIGVIRGGFETGFKEAQNVLDGLKVLGGDVATQIDKTYALVLKGYDAFLAGPGSAPDPDGPAAAKG